MEKESLVWFIAVLVPISFFIGAFVGWYVPIQPTTGEIVGQVYVDTNGNRALDLQDQKVTEEFEETAG